MVRYEYMMRGVTVEQAAEILSALGEDGWELASAFPMSYEMHGRDPLWFVFKRQKEER